jgi:hypothetical protein
MPDAVQSVSVSIRSSADGSEVSLPWELATTELLASAGPWRTFRWHNDWATAVGDTHPRTAAILRSIADSYMDEGRRNDEEARRFLEGLDA